MTTAKPASISAAPDLFAFQWARVSAGYDLRVPSAGKAGTTSGLLLAHTELVPKAGKAVVYAPRAIPDLHRRFAFVGDGPADVLAFVNEFGLLQTKSGPQGETVDGILAARDHLRGALDAFDELAALEGKARRARDEAWDEGRRAHFDEADFRSVAAEWFNTWAAPGLVARLVATDASGAGGLALTLEPRSLLAAMWLQVAEELTGGPRTYSCTWCRRPMSPKRASRITCSDACRQAKSKHERKEQAAAAKADRPKKGGSK